MIDRIRLVTSAARFLKYLLNAHPHAREVSGGHHETVWHSQRDVLALLASAGIAGAQQHVDGQTGPGSLYALDLPAAWNGDLVVYAHGILDPVLPVALPSGQDDFATVRDALMARGFAVASSSFSANGFALKDAAQRTHQLTAPLHGAVRKAATRGAGRPLAGLDRGAAAGRDLPEQYDGALVMCGFVGGTPHEIAYMANARIAFDYFFPA